MAKKKGKLKAAIKKVGAKTKTVTKKATKKVASTTKKVAKKTGKAVKTAAKKTGKAVKAASKNVVHTLKKVADNVVGDAKYVALFPFRVAMVAALKKKGKKVTIKTPMKDTSEMFYKEIILKQSHLEHIEFQHVDEADQSTGEIVGDVATSAANIAMPGTGSLIKIIISFFTGSKKKKSKEDAIAAGKTPSPETDLTPEEKIAVDEDTPVSDEVAQAAEDHDEAQDKLAAITPGAEDSNGNVLEPENPDKEEAIEKARKKKDILSIPKEERVHGDGNNYGVLRHIRANS